MNCFRYKMDHDYGFAPNPFHGVLSLATCKGSQLRNNGNLEIGDWVIGLGSVAMGNLGKIIYAMQVEEKITFDQYWEDPRFHNKKPVINGTLVQMYGDNVYHTVDGKVVQEHCAHSLKGGGVNKDHLQRDSDGKYVLLSRRFYYFGDHCPEVPKEFSYILNNSRSTKFWDLHDDDVKINAFVSWLEENYSIGIHGDPCNWKEYNLTKLDIYEDEEDK